jgi:hypothetical protein
MAQRDSGITITTTQERLRLKLAFSQSIASVQPQHPVRLDVIHPTRPRQLR